MLATILFTSGLSRTMPPLKSVAIAPGAITLTAMPRAPNSLAINRLSVSTAAFTDLVGSDKYVKAINTAAKETYPENYTQGVTITISGVAGSRTVTYAP